MKISVRNLVEFILRSGNLDASFTGSNRMSEGTKGHQKVQKSRGEGYKSEVPLSFSIECENFVLTVDGRADGIFTEDDCVVIEEIKTTTQSLEYIDENHNTLHWAQVKCYAYIYAEQNSIDTIGIQLTYYELETEETKLFRKTLQRDELKDYFYSLINKYIVWASFSTNWNIKRNASIKEMKFPFENYRKGQKELAKAVYKTINTQNKLFVQAPTGIGKTVSTLFPTVKAIGEDKASKIFYLTARTTTRQVAEEAFLKMRDLGLEFKTITLTAKEKICPNKKCNPELCNYAIGHFDRVNEAIFSALSNENSLTREVIEEYSRRYNVCPFEYSLDLCLWADCIICDYNYVFDPIVYLKRFFLYTKEEYVFLIDEAHNLVDRAREMFSAELSKQPFLQLKKIMKTRDKNLYKILDKLNKFMIDMKKQCEEEERGFLVKQEEPQDLCLMLKHFITEADKHLATNHNVDDELLELYFNAMAFVKISEFYDERYVTYFEIAKNDTRIKLYCQDPSFLLSEAMKRAKAVVAFSATLTPLSYFRNILGGNEDSYLMRLSSPFYSENLCLLIADRISTKYKNRENSYTTIAEYIKTVVTQRQGNYMVYFPSYKYMNEVVIRFVDICPDVHIILQSSSMNDEQRDTFLESFQPDLDKTLVGFGVLGGIFSEGVDLKGERLIGAVVVGVGLPQLNIEQDIIMRYFNEKNDQGYEYAYMFPGMNKVLQAAGRVIRSEDDRGVVLLIDERFSHENYNELFPEEWNHNVKVRNLRELEKCVQTFWENE